MSESKDSPQPTSSGRSVSYGQARELTLVDRFGVYLSARAVRRYLRSAPSSRKPSVLDLGCGYHASMLRALEPDIARGVAVDVALSPDLAESGKIETLESPLDEALPRIADDSVDLVLLLSVLEHLWNPLEILSGCARVLRPGGAFLLNVPTWTGKTLLEISAFRFGWSPRLEIDDHKMYYSRRDLWPLLVRAGFKPSEIRLRYHKFGLNLFGVVSTTTPALGSPG